MLEICQVSTGRCFKSKDASHARMHCMYSQGLQLLRQTLLMNHQMLTNCGSLC